MSISTRSLQLWSPNRGNPGVAVSFCMWTAPCPPDTPCLCRPACISCCLGVQAVSPTEPACVQAWFRECATEAQQATAEQQAARPQPLSHAPVQLQPGRPSLLASRCRAPGPGPGARPTPDAAPAGVQCLPVAAPNGPPNRRGGCGGCGVCAHTPTPALCVTLT